MRVLTFSISVLTISVLALMRVLVDVYYFLELVLVFLLDVCKRRSMQTHAIAQLSNCSKYYECTPIDDCPDIISEFPKIG